MLLRTSENFFTWKGTFLSCSVPPFRIMSLKDLWRQCHLLKSVVLWQFWPIDSCEHHFLYALGKICVYCKGSSNDVIIKQG